jgi:hypothetical protein
MHGVFKRIVISHSARRPFPTLTICNASRSSRIVAERLGELRGDGHVVEADVVLGGPSLDGTQNVFEEADESIAALGAGGEEVDSGGHVLEDLAQGFDAALVHGSLRPELCSLCLLNPN